MLTRTRNVNTGLCKDAVTGLHELFSANFSLVDQELPSIIEYIPPLFYSRDTNVRKAVRKLFSYLCENIAKERIQPFFPQISAHLCSAMTKLDEDIQISSLYILDVLLKYYPSLTTDSSYEILKNFLELISKQSGSNRTLLTNPTSRLSKHRYRSEIISRLQVFLTSLEKDFQISHDTEMDKYLFGNDIKREKLTFTMRKKGSDLHSKRNEFNKFSTTLFSLLIDIWMEYLPLEVGNSNLSVDIADPVNNISKIFCSVLNIAHNMERNESFDRQKSKSSVS